MEDVIINREEFYLNTGRILTNNNKVLEYSVGIERLYNFGEEPIKEEILRFVELVKKYQKEVKTLTEQLREHGIVKEKI